ncbi:hypothetical protein ABKA04_005605 [Annulohypoxylon sp. FPYF3050]
MASNIIGKSSRVYVPGEVLQRHHKDHKLSIFKAQSGHEVFVFKRVPRPFYDLSLRLAAEFAGSRRLRMHIDCNQEECILIYPYFRGTLLSLIQDEPGLHVLERKKIMRHTGEAIQELHSKDWIHIDVKPDNILVNWTCDEQGNATVTDVALGDFDIAYKSENGEPRQTPYAIGNAMWRSPEGQTGMGVTKASDIFSFGLVELVKRGIPPEQEILIRHFSYFGLVLEGLLKQVNSDVWRDALMEASAAAENAVKDQPEMKFEHWGREIGPEAQSMISTMINPDPSARATIGEVLAHPWWQDDS